MTLHSTTALLALASLAACASAPPPPPQKQAWDRPVAPSTAPPPVASTASATAQAPAPPLEDPRDSTPAAYAARYPAPEACEAAARRLLKSSPDKAWVILRACVERGKFTLLSRLVDGAWEQELQRRNDAALLLGKVVAARGGDTMGDLGTLRQARIPIFGLEPAMTSPEVFKGRVLLFRARIEEVKPQAGNKATVRLAQVELAGRVRYVAGDTQYRSTSTSSSSGSGSASGSYRANRGGQKSTGSGSASGSYSGSRRSEYTSGTERRRVENDLQDTGRIALARMNSVDPFFEPGRDFVVVGRFDGVRQEPGESEDGEESAAILTLYGYFEASPILVAD